MGRPLLILMIALLPVRGWASDVMSVTQRQACLRTRKASVRMLGVSIAIYAVGGWFAFVQPWLGSVD